MNSIWTNNLIWYPYFENYMPLEKPPTLVNILNSIYTTEHGKKPRVLDIPVLCQKYVFDFEYDLSDNVDKNKFEQNWIRHFLMRRIGTETYSAFLIELMAKINEVMPKYNLMFDALGKKFNLFSGGSYTKELTEKETIDRDKTGSRNTNETIHMESETASETDGTADNRHSDTPQNHLENIQNGEYVTDYTYNQSEASDHSESTNDRTGTATEENGENEDTERGLNRTETKTGEIENKTDALLKYMNESQSIYTMIYRDCDELFYQIF